MKNFTIFLFLVIFGLNYTVFFGSLPPGIKMIKQPNGYKVKFNIPEYKSSSIPAEGDNYSQLSINDYGITPEIGLPCLPAITFNLFISKNETTPVIKNIVTSKSTITLSSKIYPTQAPWPKLFSQNERPFTINREYYNTKGTAKPFVVVSDPFFIRGVKGVRISIYPFSYNPADNELTIINSGSFYINLAGTPQTNEKHSALFNKYLSKVFINYEANFSNPSYTNNFLIITAPEYESTLPGFIAQKIAMGYNVSVVNTNTTGNSAVSIKAYIQQQYDNPLTRPEYVLLVGDVDKIPEWVGGGEDNPYTDLNYSLLEGNDLYPDVFLGRFSVSNTTELTNIINKTIFMDNNINTLPLKGIFMASFDNYTISEGTHNYVIDTFFTPNGYTTQKLYCFTYGATTQQLINALNANQSFAVYSGHGAITYWADGPLLYQDQVSDLTNKVYPFIYSFACLTGQYEYPVCFGETWLRSLTGASVYWGSTVTSYWDEDDVLERELFKSMFSDHMIQNTPMYDQAKIYFVNNYGDITPTVQRYLEMYNCLGDPSLFEAPYGPSIAHNPLPNTENMNGPYIVNCTITTAGSAIDPSRTRIFWTRTTSYDSTLMASMCGNNWTASFNGNGNPATYRYYIKAVDMMNRVVTSPVGAPANYHSFIAMPDTGKPVIVHTPIVNVPFNQWPAAINATVTDLIGIDSAWVNWYRNNISSGIKHFRLNNMAENDYSGLFNSDTSQVTNNDQIFYRICAKANSINQNCDSTPLYSFPIVSYANVCIGTGASPIEYPFGTNRWGAKTDIIYTFDEIQSSGGTSGAITKIGFDIVSASSQLMNGFTIKMQNTALKSLTGFIKDGWTVVYNGTYSIPGTGFQSIDLQTPFAYSGTQNLAIEICFGDTNSTIATMINGSPTDGMTYEVHLYNTDGCDQPSGLSESIRPNICLTISLPIGITNHQQNIPIAFSLSQNYPNPFNPVTKIKYQIAKNCDVKLVIYDILGREVSTLVNGKLQPGTYEIEWNGSNYASGVYFYQIKARTVGSSTGDFVQTKKMVLVK